MVFKSIMALIISTVLSAVFSMIINIILFNKNVKKLEKQSIKSKNVIKKSLKYSLPLLPSIFLWLLQSTIDRLIISTYLSSEV
ncbi:oligosaccharide flippase family protein, partial [Escherichia coli]|nr:oligosaccharide flippase family protein [Escherichia coli]